MGRADQATLHRRAGVLRRLGSGSAIGHPRAARLALRRCLTYDRAAIIDGEELLGAKQNRVVNLTILVAAESKLIIPVSCVEAGRWRAKSSRFATAPRTQYATGRAKRMAQVSRSMADSGARASDQSAIWADIACLSERMHTTSSTSAMEQVFTDHATSIDAYVTGLVPVDGQVGALFAVGNHIVGFDLLDDAGTVRSCCRS